MPLASITLLGQSHAFAQAPGPHSPSGQAASPKSSESAPRYAITGWQGHRACPDQDRFRKELDQALGPRAEGASNAAAHGPMQVSIQLKKRRGSFHLELATEDETGKGQRQLHAANCEELIRTAAIIVSLAMQPDLLFANESEREVEVVPDEEGVQGQAGDDEDPGFLRPSIARRSLLPYDDSSTSDRLQVSVSLAAVGDLGTLPRAAIGLGIVASARSKRLRLSFRLTQWAEQRQYVTSFKESRGGNFDYLSASLDLCASLWSGPVSLGACGILGLGRLNGESIVSDVPTAQTHIMANAGPGVFVSLPTGSRSALRVQGDLVVQFVRPNYSVEVLDEEDDTIVVTRQIHQPAPISAHIAASWGMAF